MVGQLATGEGGKGDASGADVGATARRGMAVVGGSTVGGGSSISNKRPSHHKFKSPKQFELKQS